VTAELAPEAVRAGLSTATIPSEVACFARLPSTMDEARRRASSGATEGLVVLAEEQTAGRGRLGRPWVAPPGSALLLSLLLRPRWLAPERAFALTMLAATALCAAVEEVAGLRPALKWPNDMLLPQQNAEGRMQNAEASPRPAPSSGIQHSAFSIQHSSPQAKCAGILAELHLQAGAVEWAVIGVGVNVHAHPPPDQTAYPATSLDAALGRRADRLALLRALLVRLDGGYVALRAGGYGALFAEWRARLATLGESVRVSTPAGIVEGVAEEVTPAGALLVRAADGALHTVTTGDVQA
jgi:BirA family biotin operon repressor/biotin-[acetyl-CoA-carboxylase] ligase